MAYCDILFYIHALDSPALASSLAVSTSSALAQSAKVQVLVLAHRGKIILKSIDGKHTCKKLANSLGRRHKLNTESSLAFCTFYYTSDTEYDSALYLSGSNLDLVVNVLVATSLVNCRQLGRRLKNNIATKTHYEDIEFTCYENNFGEEM